MSIISIGFHNQELIGFMINGAKYITLEHTSYSHAILRESDYEWTIHAIKTHNTRDMRQQLVNRCTELFSMITEELTDFSEFVTCIQECRNNQPFRRSRDHEWYSHNYIIRRFDLLTRVGLVTLSNDPTEFPGNKIGVVSNMAYVVPQMAPQYWIDILSKMQDDAAAHNVISIVAQDANNWNGQLIKLVLDQFPKCTNMIPKAKMAENQSYLQQYMEDVVAGTYGKEPRLISIKADAMIPAYAQYIWNRSQHTRHNVLLSKLTPAQIEEAKQIFDDLVANVGISGHDHDRLVWARFMWEGTADMSTPERIRFIDQLHPLALVYIAKPSYFNFAQMTYDAVQYVSGENFDAVWDAVHPDTRKTKKMQRILDQRTIARLTK